MDLPTKSPVFYGPRIADVTLKNSPGSIRFGALTTILASGLVHIEGNCYGKTLTVSADKVERIEWND